MAKKVISKPTLSKKKVKKTAWYAKVPVLSSLLASLGAFLLVSLYLLLPHNNVLGITTSKSLSNSVFVTIRTSTGRIYSFPKGGLFCLFLIDKYGNHISSGNHCYKVLPRFLDVLTASSIPAYIAGGYTFTGSFSAQFSGFRFTPIAYNGSCGSSKKSCVLTVQIPNSKPTPTPTPRPRKTNMF